jgi:energy-coupling factor transport system permease protein
MQPIYIPGASLLHRLHPLTKLVAAALLVAAIYLLPWLLAPVILFVVLLALASLSGVAQPFLSATLRVLMPITISLFVIQGILFPPPGATPLFAIGPITLTREGLTFAFRTSTRLLAFTGAFLLLLQTTHPADLVSALTERGLPRSIGYILLVSLQIVPDMSARANAVLEAQRSRGLETQGGLRRVRALVPLVGPLIIGALVDVEERAMALESRAYTVSGPKTSLRQLVDTPGQRAARLLMLLAIVGLVAWRLALAFDIL